MAKARCPICKSTRYSKYPHYISYGSSGGLIPCCEYCWQDVRSQMRKEEICWNIIKKHGMSEEEKITKMNGAKNAIAMEFLVDLIPFEKFSTQELKKWVLDLIQSKDPNNTYIEHLKNERFLVG